MTTLSHTLRKLCKSPGFTTVSILTLTVGIGAVIAIYSVVRATILAPIPGPEPERLFQIGSNYGHQDKVRFHYGVTLPVYRAVRDREDLFADHVWCISQSFMRPTDSFTEPINCALVAPHFFEFFNAKPLLGRTFSPEDTIRTGEHRRPIEDGVIVISHAKWHSIFQGDKHVIGKTIDVYDHRFTVIGVMPQHFEFPYGYTECWLPIAAPQVDPDESEPNWTEIYAKTQPGISSETVLRQMEALTQYHKDLTAENLNSHRIFNVVRKDPKWAIVARPLTEKFMDAGLKQTMFGMFGAIACILAIICANIANLTLLRVERQQQESAIRSALGASRSHLIGERLLECLLLSFCGGAIGLILAKGFITLFLEFVSEYAASLRAVELDWNIAAIALLISIATGLAFGLPPVINAARTHPGNALKHAGTRTTAGVAWRRLRGLIAASEIALAVVLLVGAGLMVQSVVRILNVDPGFDPNALVTASIHIPAGKKYFGRNSRTNRTVLHQKLLTRIQALPSVSSVSVEGSRAVFPHAPEDGIRLDLRGSDVSIGPHDYFELTGMQLLTGRRFEPKDADKNSTSIIINEALADSIWPDENPIGKTVENKEKTQRMEVIGVVANAWLQGRNYNSLGETTHPKYFKAYRNHPTRYDYTLVIRTRGDLSQAVSSIHAELHTIEPGMVEPRIKVISQEMHNTHAIRQAYMMWLSGFALVGTFLAAIGVYGVMAHSSASRTREIGIRMAMGASRRRALGTILASSLKITVGGIALGLSAAFASSRLLEAQLFQVSTTEPFVFSVATGLMALIAVASSLPAALRASRTDPMNALRHE